MTAGHLEDSLSRKCSLLGNNSVWWQTMPHRVNQAPKKREKYILLMWKPLLRNNENIIHITQIFCNQEEINNNIF